ncbi:condensation domain-containing protein [Kitasatospora purpeofusca]|uniref:Condensation domain-containing protein n=1 Tax=Kitasatospora purpeofusca TaxID=67352 RepID=A0ABZ1U588_9ACTN|nr:condensation domain-containing protein [Kitasatospora purpeofusca]
MSTSLSAEREELLRRRLFERSAKKRPALTEGPERGENPELSFAQRRLWFLDQLRPDDVAYVIPAAYRLRGELDADALERALAGVVERHEVLRTRFALNGDEPYQLVEPAAFVLRREDLSRAADPAGAARAEAAAEAATPFALDAGPLLRVRLLKLAAEDHVLLVTVHHSVFDGVSLGLLTREVTAGYAAALAGERPELPELPLQYADFAVRQRARLSGERLAGHLRHWREQLADVPQVLELPVELNRPLNPSFRGRSVPFTVPAEVTEGLRGLAREHRASLYMVTLAAYQAVLGRHARVNDLLVGSPVAGRIGREVEQLIGFFVNTVPLRARLSGEPTFAELVDQVRDTALSAFSHQELPIEKLVEELAPTRDLSRNPLIQVWFNLLNTEGGAEVGELALAGLDVRQFETDGTTTRFDVELHLFDNGTSELTGELIYATDLFSADTARRLAGHYLNFLTAVAADPTLRISRVRIITDEELDLLDRFNSTATEAS